MTFYVTFVTVSVIGGYEPDVLTKVCPVSLSLPQNTEPRNEPVDPCLSRVERRSQRTFYLTFIKFGE